MRPTVGKHRAPRLPCWRPLEPLEPRLMLSGEATTAGAAPTTLTLSPLTKSTTFGQTITLQGKLSATGASVARSTVSLIDLDANTDLEDVRVSSSGTFKFTFPASALTMHLAATFVGSNVLAGAQSATLPIAILPASSAPSLKLDRTGTELLATDAPPMHFAAGLLTDFTGTLTLLDGGQPVATASAAANAIFDAQQLSPGMHTLTLSYSGNNFFLPENFTMKLKIPPVLPTTTTVLVGNTLNVAAPVLLTAVVRPTAKGGWAVDGSATFYADGTKLGTAPVKNGIAKLYAKFLYPGDEDITADYTPTSLHLPSTSDAATASISEPNEIDVLALYTPEALAAFGSAANIETIVQSELNDTNQAFINSQVPAFTHLNAVAAEDYTESGNLQLDLERLDDPSDGFMDDAYTKRQLYGADLVVLVDSNGTPTGNNEGFVGEATEFGGGNPNRAFIVIDGGAPEGDYALPHEIGHTLGAGHAADDPYPDGAAADAHGYRFRGPDGTLYRDIMAYDPGTPIPYYSNPNVTYEGVPVGTIGADNARIMTQNAPTVSRYMTPQPEGAIRNAAINYIDGYVFDAAATGPITIRITVQDSTHLSDIQVILTASDRDDALSAQYGVDVYHFSFAPYIVSTVLTHVADIYGLDPLTNKYVLLDTRFLSNQIITPP